MRNRRSVNAAAGLAMAGAATVVYFAANEWPPSVDRARHLAIGRALARETLREVKPGVGVVAIVRDTSAFKHPESDLQLRGFRDALGDGGASIAVLQALQVDPLRALEVPPGDFFELIRKTPAGTAIVSFMGPPMLSPEQRSRLGEVKPKIIAFCPGALPRRTDLRGAFESGLLSAAVVERADAPVPSTASKEPRPGDGFEAHYRIVHASDAATLPAMDSAKETL